MLADSGLGAVSLDLVTESCGLAAVRAYSHYLAGIKGSFALYDAALLTHLTGLNVLCDNVKTFNDDLLLLGGNLKDLAFLALVLAGKDNNSVACFNV
jgi:hypothetical protein